MSEGSNSEEDARPKHAQLQLTPEERMVLLSCRRNSLIRGFVSGSGVCMLIYWFKAQGRVPALVNRYPGFIYSMAFFASFVSGAGSYQKTCFQKIMSLENSVLADQIRKVKRFDGNVELKGHVDNQSVNSSQPRRETSTFPSSMPKQQSQVTSPPPNVKLDEGPSINLQLYNRDRSMLTTREKQEEQPSAFVSEHDRNQVPFTDTPQEPTPKKGRTFDEIREENRRKQNQRSYPPKFLQTEPRTGGGERKKRNKYGDEIEE